MKVSTMITGKNSGRKRRSRLKGRITAALCFGWLEFGDAGMEGDCHRDREEAETGASIPLLPSLKCTWNNTVLKD